MFQRSSSSKYKTPDLGEKQRQWLWFVGLIAAGMISMLMLAGLVRMMLNIGA